MRKILLAVCCANKTGNTMKLADAFMKGALEAGHEVKKAYMGDDLHGCRGCGYCQLTSKGCVIHDVMDEVYPLYDWCDTIVLASPLFFMSVSAQTKSFLDRLYAKGKEDQYQRKAMALLMTAGDDSEEIFSQSQQFFNIIAMIHGGENLGSYFAGGCDGDPGHHVIPEVHLENAEAFGRNLK
ncbi:MAG: flavodoxin family protein [Solobacterium sp.]|nr:flavodoxin family protein [Solobacterium sp.]